MQIQLFCFPFAGGSKYSYAKFLKCAPSNIKPILLEYPGRGTRYKEDLLYNMEGIVEDLFLKIKNNLDLPYAFFGHSMGALVAYLIAKKIIIENLTPPLYLFLSGRGAPSLIEDLPPVYLLPKQQFLNALRETGGSVDEILSNTEIINFYEPILRADFQAVETYIHKSSTPINIPILVMIGSEEKITLEAARAWQNEFSGLFEVKEFAGNHFFIFQHRLLIMKEMVYKLFQYLNR